MAKRQLSKEEKSFASSNINLLQEEISYLTAMVKRQEVNIETAPAIYARQLQELNRELKKNKELLNESTKTVEVLQDQIQNGVQTKETTKS